MFRETIEVKTVRDGIIDITDRIVDIVNKSGVKNGLCNVFMPATTAGFVMNENDKSLMDDFRRFFKIIIDDKKTYSHPDNAFSHLRASLASTEKTIPIQDGELLLGTWQSILLFEFDTRPRNRSIVVTIIESNE